jgi:site-specific recombinase XerC
VEQLGGFSAAAQPLEKVVGVEVDPDGILGERAAVKVVGGGLGGGEVLGLEFQSDAVWVLVIQRVGVFDHYLTEVRPRFGVRGHPALWVTERCGRLSKRGVNEAFETARNAAGLPAELDLHSLRHSMITHLVEFDYPERFVQDQAGHATASSTAIYTGVSDEYRNQLLRRKLTERHSGLWEDDQP